MPKLVILDGNSLLYRGFFAMRALSTSDNLPTNAVYSFVLMLLTILERDKPDAIFAAFDPPVATFRHLEMESYKANRQSMPDDLKPQRQLARDAARVFGAPVVEVDGFEADDVCGTLAEQGKAMGYDVVIVTGDGDALQLVDDGSGKDGSGSVRVMITVKGVTDTILYDEAAVKARYGLTPAQIPDFKGLKGDSSDNLPGVPGIGEKGATKLLQEFGTLEQLLESTDQLPDKMKMLMTTHRAIAKQCKHLATIVRDVPMPDWVDLTPDHQQVGPDFDAVRALFEKLEFRTLLKRLPTPDSARSSNESGSDEKSPASPDTANAVFELCNTAIQVDRLTHRLEAFESSVGVYVDAFPDPDVKPPAMTFMTAHAAGLAFALHEHAYYVPRDLWTERMTAWLGGDRAKAAYDGKFTYGLLRREGVSLRGVRFDALLAAYLINAGRSHYTLSELASEYAGYRWDADAANSADEAMHCAAAVHALASVLRTRLEHDGLLALLCDLELPLSDVIGRMEQEGVTVDADLLSEVGRHMGEQGKELEGRIFALAGGEPFSIGSVKQLQEVLFERLKLPTGKKTKTGYSTGADVLEDLAAKGHEIAGLIIQWRELTKLKSTYADSLPTLINARTGKIHTTLSQTVASTGRLSSSNPNLQNIPIRTEVGRGIRRAFIPPMGGVLLSADYSQIELRLFAHMTKDAALMEAFRTDRDIHEETARRIFGLEEGQPVSSDQRRQAKTINFAVIYGAGPFRVSTELGIPQAKASELIKAYFALYPGVRTFIDQILEDAREKGYVETLLGRRRYVPDVNSRVFQFRQSAEREAANMPVQGSSADIIKIAMLHVDKRLREEQLQAKMILQVHDELLFTCPPDEIPALGRLVRECMEGAYPLDVPLRVEVKSGKNWWDVTPLEDEDADAASTLAKSAQATLAL